MSVRGSQVIREELGADASTLFAELSDEPVAAASLGQVYRGRLHSGEEVAVKVQRPSIGESIAIDMLLLRRLLRAIDATVTPTLGLAQPLVPLLDEFAEKLFREMDYQLEVRRWTEGIPARSEAQAQSLPNPKS